MARPTKYTPLLERRLLEYVERGATLTVACQTVGISIDTLANWRRRYTGFSAGLREAEGRAALRWLDQVEAGAAKNWLAAAWLLERRLPHEYGRHLVHEQTTSYDEPALRQLAIERGLDPDAFVEAVARAQLAAQASKRGQPGNSPIPLHARGTRFGAGL